MKRITILAFISCVTVSVVAQIAHWKVEPRFDAIHPLENGFLEVSLDKKAGLYDSKGNDLLPIAYDSIGAFVDEAALLFIDSKFVGIVRSDGKHIDLSEAGYDLKRGMEFFSDGFLPVERGGRYYFINRHGEEVAGPFADVRPYFNGYAAVCCYVDMGKSLTETFLAYMNTSQHLVSIPEFEKTDDLSFISSFRDGKAVCVYKKRAYYLTDSLDVRPISVDSIVTKKSIVTFANKSILFNQTDGGYSTAAKNAVLYFNTLFQLNKIESADSILYSYETPISSPQRKDSEFECFGQEGNWGLKYDGSIILPEQFSDVKLVPGVYALVELGGKWGILTVDPKNQFVFKLNNNEHIGFNHRYFTAKLSALMPSYIKCNSTTVFSKSADCEIQVESRHENENIERNTLTYDCRLSIPASLSDTLSVQEYTYALKYDGLTSIDYKVPISEWYVKYYEVELSNTKFTLSANDTISVEFDLVKTDAARNDDTNYFKTVELITSETEDIPLNKITENHYSFRIGGIDRERLSFIVRITEIGCPSIEYPFEMVFAKPATKSKNKSVNVTVSAVRKNATQKPAEQQAVPKADPIFVPK